MLEAKLQFCLDRAQEAFKDSEFSLTVKFFDAAGLGRRDLKKDPWQVTLTRNQGDQRGEFFFCQGSAATLQEAADKLQVSLQTYLAEFRQKTQEQLDKNTLSLTEKLNVLDQVLGRFHKEGE